jgi:hypothetical protein
MPIYVVARKGETRAETKGDRPETKGETDSG